MIGNISYGLGGNATSYILNAFTLKNRKVEVIVVPDAGGIPSGGGFIPTVFPTRTTQTPKPKPARDLIIIRTTINNQTTEKQFSIPKNRTPVVIRLVGIINTITTRVAITFNGITRLINKIRMK